MKTGRKFYKKACCLTTIMDKKMTFFLSRQNFTPAAKHQTWKRRRMSTNRQKYSSNIVACKIEKKIMLKKMCYRWTASKEVGH